MLIPPWCCHKAVQICHSLETYNSVMQTNFILMLRTLIGGSLLNKSCTLLTQHVPNLDTSLPVSKKTQRRSCTVHVSCCKSISQKLDSNLQWSILWPMYAVFPQCGLIANTMKWRNFHILEFLLTPMLFLFCQMWIEMAHRFVVRNMTLGIILGKTEATKSSHHGHWGRYPIDT